MAKRKKHNTTTFKQLTCIKLHFPKDDATPMPKAHLRMDRCTTQEKHTTWSFGVPSGNPGPIISCSKTTTSALRSHMSTFPNRQTFIICEEGTKPTQELLKLLSLFEDKHSSDLHSRHAAGILKLSKQKTTGFVSFLVCVQLYVSNDVSSDVNSRHVCVSLITSPPTLL
jgi:hypothetical protein